MKVLKITAFVAAILLLAGLAAWLGRYEIGRMAEGLPPFSHGAGEYFTERVAMADGIELHTAISLPAGDGPWPTVLLRNPYAEFGSILQDQVCGRFIRYGYGCVLQQVRGRGESGGEWDPLENEMDDGRDTLAWLVKQGFQDGNIALVGPSYLAAVQWAAAASGLPPEVKTLVPAVFTTDNRPVMFQDGMFRHEVFSAWAVAMQDNETSFREAGKQYQAFIRHRPHIEADTAVLGRELPWYRRMVSGAAASASQWDSDLYRSVREVPPRLNVPILSVAGWYDVFTGPQIDDWNKLASQSRSRLIIGPWDHLAGTSKDLETPNAEGGLFQWSDMLDWLNHHLRGEELQTPPGVSAYVMQENRWIHRPVWPPATDSRRLFLSKLRAANDCEGGRLLDEPDPAPESVRFEYDPADPVPTRGGSGLLAFALPFFDGEPPGNVWQDGLCERPDVLTFQTEPLTEDWHIAGRVEVGLRVATSAEDSSFTAKLVEVLPDGRAINIRDSISRLSYRNRAAEPMEYQPGERVFVSMKLWPIEWVVRKGSRLRLDVSSSDFPKYHVHPNIAGPWAEVSETTVAEQTLYGGRGTPSFVEVPLVRESAGD